MKGKAIIYQLLLRAFGKRECTPGGSYLINGSGKFNDITPEVLQKLKKLSVSAVWYTGVISHATKTHFRGIKDSNPALVKGEAGSPYSIRNYFDVDPALAVNPDNRISEFEALIKRTHSAGMEVVIDFIPNHVAREYTSYFSNENFYLLDAPFSLPEGVLGEYHENPAKATGNDVFSPQPTINDWYETVKLNYSNQDTWVKMLDIILFWASKGVDGFRCDMVELVPVEFFSWAFKKAKERYPNLYFIAEVYQKENYSKYANIGGFDLLYDKSGFYDALRGISSGEKGAWELSREWQEIGDLQPKMLNFLENHDEQRVASDFFAGSARASFCALSVMLLFNTAPFLLYFGQEYGERGMEEEGYSGIDGRTSIFDYCIVPSIKRSLLGKSKVDEERTYKEYCKLLRIATGDALFSKGKTFDLMYANPVSDHFNPQKQFAFARGWEGTAMVVVSNFDYSPVNVKINIPKEAFDYLGINCSNRTIEVKVSARDYARVDISNKKNCI